MSLISDPHQKKKNRIISLEGKGVFPAWYINLIGPVLFTCLCECGDCRGLIKRHLINDPFCGTKMPLTTVY